MACRACSRSALVSPMPRRMPVFENEGNTKNCLQGVQLLGPGLSRAEEDACD